ncbi:putative C-S lyase [Alphaproteobacteria bacterium GH1-50]|uniref:cysteine-S-conjugate beta-lyase n=1 Tax=Kangsaoukella pontilimi TaxID=2691042 RepID=A0A7C9ISX0_9RHOB|nr:PatB family C-S lyase [Kangsaoukella pontilimi]MXQ08385.1 putative C-S lyase [Kangsaoukella pontilimi]
MGYDFDTPLPLRGANTSKYDNIARAYGTDDPDLIPMWVADMDFAAAPAILAALRAEVERGYMGYFADTRRAGAAFAEWARSRYGWEVDPDIIRYTTGVMSGFVDTIEIFSEKGDGVIVFPPAYHEFAHQTQAVGRTVLESPLKVVDGRHEMDLDALERSLTGKERILTFCSPHNPGGRIWTVDEIRAVADFCKRHDLIMISDEVHMDLSYPGTRPVPTAVAAPEVLDRLVVVTAPSKAFNIAGLKTGMLIVPDRALRARLDPLLRARYGSPNRLGMAALTAAYAEGGDWSDTARAYIADNFALFRDRVGALPGVSVLDMRATYLSWVDFTGTGMDNEELMSRLLNQAKVVPSPGPQFGSGGSGHMRFNVALPRPTLEKAIAGIEAAFADLQ